MSAWLLLSLFGVIALVVAAFVFFSSARFDPRPPPTQFHEVTREAGILFEHNNGASSDNLLPETMGSGVAFLDYDNDGDQDLLFANSNYWPWERGTAKESTALALYRNDGDGQFEEVGEALGIAARMYGMGIAIGDYDNDGWSDVFLTGVGGNRLFRNLRGERFDEVTRSAGVGGLGNDWSTSAAWLDVDGDGLLDLFVCNYVSWAKELGIELAFKLAGIGRAYAPQVNFTGAIPYLYLNNGDGTFRSAVAGSGLDLYDEETGYPLARSLAVAPIDMDEDGRIDLVVANHEMDTFVFRNAGGGTFQRVDSSRVGVEGGDGAMGIDAARLSDEDTLGIAVGSFANELNKVYRVSGDSVVLSGEALDRDGAMESAFQRFGMFFFDYDLDGRLDLLAVNGYLEKEINRIDPEMDFRRPAQLLWNAGVRSRERFLEVAAERVGEDLFRPIVGRGAAFADIDGNGSLDVVITQNGGPPILLRNRAPADRNWLRIKLVGTRSNRDAIGAKVEARVGYRTLEGRVMPTRSYLSQSELPVTIGLGKAWKVREVVVTWPDGSRQSFEDVPVNRETRLAQE